MTTYYVHTRAGGFKRWVCIEKTGSKAEAECALQNARKRDDPMWAAAEYLISESLHPSPDEKGDVYE